MANFRSSFLPILLFLTTCQPGTGNAADRIFGRLIGNGIELQIHEVKPEDGLVYVNRIDVIDNGVVMDTKLIEGQIAIDDSKRYLAITTCREIFCSSEIQLFRLPRFEELEPVVVPDGTVIVKIVWDETWLRIKYGTGLRKDSKNMSVDVAERKHKTSQNQKK